jgi:hypothetical protein
MEEELSFWKAKFWDLILMKLFRNFASVKYQWMVLLYIPVIWGMFHISPKGTEPWISSTVGLSFLSGGYVTLALGRIYIQTRLTENGNGNENEKESDDK